MYKCNVLKLTSRVSWNDFFHVRSIMSPSLQHFRVQNIPGTHSCFLLCPKGHLVVFSTEISGLFENLRPKKGVPVITYQDIPSMKFFHRCQHRVLEMSLRHCILSLFHSFQGFQMLLILLVINFRLHWNLHISNVFYLDIYFAQACHESLLCHLYKGKNQWSLIGIIILMLFINSIIDSYASTQYNHLWKTPITSM